MAVSGACIAAAGQYEQITVSRNGKELLVRSSFSETQDVVIRIHCTSVSTMPNEEAYLIPKSAKLLDYKKYDLMHAGGDEIPAYPLPMYGTLGGNHGSAYGRAVTIPGHGLTSKDLGAELTTEKKGKFYILRVIDKDNILIHPENLGKPGFPKFAALEGTHDDLRADARGVSHRHDEVLHAAARRARGRHAARTCAQAQWHVLMPGSPRR